MADKPEEKTETAEEVEDKEAEEERKKQEALDLRLAEEKKIKAEFPYTFNDIAHQIVTVSCTSPRGRSSGSGFIAKMDGKTYLFTNQHVIMGADKISFKSATGKQIKPRGVQLSANRDIARLPLAENDGLEVTSTMTKDAPIAVFGNSEGGGVATELFGKVRAISSDKVEVTADFVSGNSGSPILNLDKQVIGIATYVTYSTTNKDGKEQSNTRRFCYRLTGDRWGTVKWNQYNEKYGKLYRSHEALIDSIYDMANIWYGNPFSRMSAGDHKDAGLRKWSDDHNSMIKRIERTMNKPLTQHQLDNTNQQICKDMSDSANALCKVCNDRARQMRFLATQKDLTTFLRDEFHSLAKRMDFAAGTIDRYGKKLSKHNYFYFKKKTNY